MPIHGPVVIPTPNPIANVDLAGLDLEVKNLAARVDYLTKQLKSLLEWANSVSNGPLSALELDGNGNLHIAQGNDLILD